jgi:hypothetical protein
MKLTVFHERWSRALVVLAVSVATALSLAASPAQAATSTRSGCFSKVNGNGQANPLPTADAGWAEEESLDLDMVSSMCPDCHIKLVEAAGTDTTSLNTAAKSGAGGDLEQLWRQLPLHRAPRVRRPDRAGHAGRYRRVLTVR